MCNRQLKRANKQVLWELTLYKHECTFIYSMCNCVGCSLQMMLLTDTVYDVATKQKPLWIENSTRTE